MMAKKVSGKRKRWLLVGSALAFVASFTVTALTLPELKPREDNYPRILKTVSDGDPGPDAFFVSQGKNELSHLALYYDLGPSIDHARRADILIIGNSRGQLGINEEIFVGEAQKLGLSVFNLSVGHADQAIFALDVIRRNDLRPRIVISSGGAFFYEGYYSNWAQEVIAMSRWEAAKAFLEYSLSWHFTSRLHRYLPYLEHFESWSYPWVHYRSWKTGWWRNTQVPGWRYSITHGTEEKSYARVLPQARELKEEMERRGALLVLSIVPYGQYHVGHLPYLARELELPYLMPSAHGLETADGSHLTPDSALRVSLELWRQLMTTPSVRAHLSLAPGS
jgi:hypothetical protein